MAAANILVAGWTALRQRDWQLLLGYGSVSHAGYFFLGLASLNYTGLGGAVFFLSAHGLAIAACFALAGAVTGATGRRDLASLGGLARRLPFIGVALAMAVLAAVGVPGFANFWGELLTIFGAFRQATLPARLAAVAGAWGLVLTATYLLRALHATLFGPAQPADAALADLTATSQRLPYVLLLAALLLLGVWPRLALEPIHASLAPLLQLLNPPG
jgi:NADH-quinone oxidoreductase subunit M